LASAFGLLDYDWDTPLPDSDRDRILSKIVAAVRKWRLEVPAILFLESGSPLSHIAGQGLVAFSPLIAPLMPRGITDVQRLNKLLERPENMQRLINLLSETESDAARK